MAVRVLHQTWDRALTSVVFLAMLLDEKIVMSRLFRVGRTFPFFHFKVHSLRSYSISSIIARVLL